MLTFLKKYFHLAGRHRYGFTLFAFLAAAALTGMGCYLFMRGFEWVLERRLDFDSAGAWCWVATPLLFLLSVELIRRLAPCAAGTGIPQAIFAAQRLSPAAEKSLRPLLSPLTMAVKVAALFLGLWAGASTGREGPTVHVAACLFLAVLLGFRRLFPGFSFDPRSAVVAGGAAGLAAAFNTPLAGVTFAVEELTVDYFSAIKDFVLMAIIIAALAAKSLTGEYSYFGRLMDPAGVPLGAMALIGVAGGAAGALFSSLILAGQNALKRFQTGTGRYLVPVLLSVGLLAVAAAAGTRVLGPGNAAAQTLLEGGFGPWTWTFPLFKMAATLLTYWSGIAGGIFAPCLSVGAAIGADAGRWLGLSATSCAILGMAAFLSGTIQAPITSFVIIFEMTGHHDMLLPVMLSSLLAFMTARLLGARHLYQALAQGYAGLLAEPPSRAPSADPNAP